MHQINQPLASLPRQLAVLCAAAGLFLAPAPSQAATIAVNTTADILNAIDGLCSLREAVINANTDSQTWADCAAGAGADILALPAGTYSFALAGADEDASATGDLDVTSEINIEGAGAGTTAIDAQGLDRVFDVMVGGNLTLRDVTITGGDAEAGSFVFGGGVLNDGLLELVDAAIVGNNANIGAAVTSLPDSTIRITRSLIAGNSATGSIGVFITGASGYMLNSTITGNTNPLNLGGVVLTSATTQKSFEFDHTTIAGNDGGQLLVSNFAVSIYGSIFANDSVTIPVCEIAETASISSNGWNIDDDGTCGLDAATDLNNMDPRLAPLADNGGPTPTLALDPASPAVDLIPDFQCWFVRDQRSIPRPQGDGCDSGAFELIPMPEPSIDPVMDVYEEGVASGDLSGTSPGRGRSATAAANRLAAIGHRIMAVGGFIADGNIEAACEGLESLDKHTDGESPPPDFVTGPDAEALNDEIEALIAELCDEAP